MTKSAVHHDDGAVCSNRRPRSLRSTVIPAPWRASRNDLMLVPVPTNSSECRMSGMITKRIE